MSPPNNEQAKQIRQIVLSGLVDKLAKRYDHELIDKSGKGIKNAYQSQILEEPIFIHPTSILFKELPEFVCFVEIVETSKMYIKGVCSIEAEWLPLFLNNQCTFEKPIVDEANSDYERLKPRFDIHRGVVMCHRGSTFGKIMWNIKPVELEFPYGVDLFKWFAKFFLEGEVITYLKRYESVLLASPSTMLKSWAK
jgi:ATP-dependent RNA helicase DHX37/DHR1